MQTPFLKKAFGNLLDLEVKHAWKTFGSKTAEEAYELFIQNPFGYVEDFRWIAPNAFTFYFPIVVRYVTSDRSKGDSDTVSSVAGILESQLEEDSRGLSPVFREITKLCRHIISHYADYDLDYDIYGDVKTRYERIAKIIESSSAARLGKG